MRIRHIPIFVTCMVVAAFALLNLGVLAWWNIPDTLLGGRMFWVAMWGVVMCLLLAAYAKTCRNPSPLYRTILLVFLFRATASLITSALDLPRTPNEDTIAQVMFGVKIYLNACRGLC